MAQAGPVTPGKIELKQPGGAAFSATQYDDEWNNGVGTLSGYTVLENPANGGRWEYAVKPAEGGNLKPGGTSALRPAPDGLEKHLRDPAAGGNAFEEVRGWKRSLTRTAEGAPTRTSRLRSR